MNLIQYITQADPEEKIVSRKAGFLDNGENWFKEYGKVKKLADRKVTDENKHQYLSCLAGKGGKLEATAVLGGGLLKEVADLAQKLPSSEARRRYGGVGNIFKDSIKDMNNNIKGVRYGLHNRGKCINLLERKLP